jgi:hypothetical protein
MKIKWLSLPILKAALLNGFLLNLFGWLGNALLLRGEWNEAATVIGVMDTPNFSGLTRELLSLAPDFMYGYLSIIVYLYIAHVEGFNLKSKFFAILLSFLFSLFATYLGLVSANLLPIKISLLTAGWGLITFFPAFMLTLWITKIERKYLT